MSPLRSVIIRVITKLDNHVVGVRFDYHEYKYRTLPINHKSHNFREKKKRPVMKARRPKGDNFSAKRQIFIHMQIILDTSCLQDGKYLQSADMGVCVYKIILHHECILY